MEGCDAQEHLGGSAGGSAALFPVVQGANTDAQYPGKLTLGQARLLPPPLEHDVNRRFSVPCQRGLVRERDCRGRGVWRPAKHIPDAV